MSRCDFKIVLLGSEHVGKTSLVLRFVNCRFNSGTPYQNTIGAAFCAKQMHSNGKDFNVGIWDTAGSERYAAMTRMYYRGAHAAIICYEPSCQASWTRLRHWLLELRTVEEELRFCVPNDSGSRRRRPPLLAQPRARTCLRQRAPLTRATCTLNSVAEHIDLFSCSLGKFIRATTFLLSF
ncbi:ras-related protein Rab-24-like isoform X2 [Maniola hyperantus]|uniref:ras-related protein Rab-24-like isoform X2 n=1 Tax=Aphantopus hyperantus TaxID=2795564 RepID=UPI0037496120